MKKGRNKCCLAVGALVAAGLMWFVPVKTEAAPCYNWEYIPGTAGYECTTPICYNGSDLTNFHVKGYRRECIGENGHYYEYKTDKEDLGCCKNP